MFLKCHKNYLFSFIDALLGQNPGQLPPDSPNVERVDCMVTEWSPWSSCSVSCGNGIVQKQRMVKREPQNGGKSCPRTLLRKRPCYGPPC